MGKKWKRRGLAEEGNIPDKKRLRIDTTATAASNLRNLWYANHHSGNWKWF
jgi:hypothetical protein